MEPIRRIWELVLDIIFPPLCVVCRRYTDHDRWSFICDKCLSTIVPERYPRTKNGKAVWCVADYREETVRRLIHSLKYRNNSAIAGLLGEMLAERLKGAGSDVRNTVIVPIPLHKRKKHQRGYNQAELIADVIGGHLGIPVIHDAVSRIRPNKPQSGMADHGERISNVRGIFAPGPDIALITGKTVIVVDDILTSGATMSEVTRILWKNGARKCVRAAVAVAA